MTFVRKRKSCKILMNNYVDKDLQSMLYPLNLTQKYVFCPKYRIENDHIVPVGLVHKLINLCFVIMSLLLFTYRWYTRYFNKKISEFYKVSDFYTNCLDFSFTLVNILLNNSTMYFKSNDYITFVLKLRDIHRFINNKIGFNRFIVGNWISIVLIFSYAVTFVLSVCIILRLPFHDYMCGFILCSVDLNTVYVIRLIKILKEKVLLWNSLTCKSSIMSDKERSEFYLRMFQAYENILGCFNAYKRSFQIVVSFFS